MVGGWGLGQEKRGDEERNHTSQARGFIVAHDEADLPASDADNVVLGQRPSLSLVTD